MSCLPVVNSIFALDRFLFQLRQELAGLKADERARHV